MIVAVVVGGGVVEGRGNGLFCGVSLVLLETAAVGVDLTGDEPEVLPLPIVLSLSIIVGGASVQRGVIGGLNK